MSRPPIWSEITAVFGGTFDPPHVGHREAVRGLFERPGIKAVSVLLTPSPAYKPCIASVESRLEMTRLNFDPGADRGFPREVSLDPREIERAGKNPPRPTYSFDTLSELRRENPKIAFVIGADQLEALHTWHRFPEVLTLCHWIILARKPAGADVAQRVLGRWEASGLVKKANDLWEIRGAETWMIIQETKAPALSSTQIREALGRNGTPPEGALLEGVWRYLKDRGLYGTRGAS